MPHGWYEEQRRIHGQHWSEVERLFGGLPPRLADQARLIRFDMALRHSTSGRFPDVFLGPRSFPLLSLAGWLHHDLQPVPVTPHHDVERRLFVAAYLLAVRTHVTAALDDEASVADSARLAVLRFCGEQAMRELMAVIPTASSSWEEIDALTRSGLEDGIERHERGRTPFVVGDAVEEMRSPWSMPARVIATATLESVGRPGIAPSIHRMLHELALALQVTADLETMHEDLLAGRLTFPILYVAQKAGLPLRPMPVPEVVLGATAVLQALPAIVDAGLERLRASHAEAEILGLACFSAFIATVENHLHAVLSTVSDGDLAWQERRPRPEPVIRIAAPTGPKAIEMAERALVADPTFRESWECHREGMFGSDEVVSRFPAGLILELLCASGIDLHSHVDEFIRFAVANGFRYYDHPWSDPDSDTLGACLRLLPFTKEPERWTPSLDRALRSIAARITSDGTVPVWFSDPELESSDRPEMIALGEGCGTVAVHLLLGALAHRSDAAGAVVAAGARGMLERIATVGLGANINYPPEYALAVSFRFLARLEIQGQAWQDDPQHDRARRALEGELDRILERRPRTPQAAALLTLACQAAARTERIDGTWMLAILSQQRSDGSWIGEPFAVAPNRGTTMSWYSSTTLTTALCREALRVAGPSGGRSRAPVLGDVPGG